MGFNSAFKGLNTCPDGTDASVWPAIMSKYYVRRVNKLVAFNIVMASRLIVII
jgi:hypothetical protein